MPEKSLRIEVLTFDGCPHADVGYRHVVEALQSEKIDAQIERVEINTPELALGSRFLGSPSVRIDGKDVEPGADDRADFGLMCRTYSDQGMTTGAPPIAMIRKAIRAHIDGSHGHHEYDEGSHAK